MHTSACMHSVCTCNTHSTAHLFLYLHHHVHAPAHACTAGHTGTCACDRRCKLSAFQYKQYSGHMQKKCVPQCRGLLVTVNTHTHSPAMGRKHPISSSYFGSKRRAQGGQTALQPICAGAATAAPAPQPQQSSSASANTVKTSQLIGYLRTLVSHV